MITLQERAALTILYQEPWRHYHTIEHVRHLLRLLDNCKLDKIERTDKIKRTALEHAIWFHDVVYDPKCKDEKNVQKSAELYFLTIPEQRFSQLAYDAIMATKDHWFSEEHQYADLINLFLDMDLEVLSWGRNAYLDYRMQIRKEYLFVDTATFARERSKILNNLLKQDKIYKSEHFAYCEAAARKNLKDEIEDLESCF